MNKYVLFILLTVFALTQAYPSSFSITSKISRLDIGNQLPQNTILSIHQDSQGFMWFGTYSGLCRYDGQKVKVYLEGQNNPYAIKGSTITAMDEDSNGNLYIATTGGGLNIYNPITELFTHYHKGDSVNKLPDNLIYDVCVSDSVVWLACASGFCKMNLETKSTSFYSVLEDSPGQNVNMPAYRVIVDGNNQVYGGTLGTGLYKFNPEKNAFESIRNTLPNTDGYKVNSIKSIMPYSNTQLLVGTNEGAFLFNTLTNNYTRFKDVYSPINSILVEDNSTVWLGTQDAGVYKYLPKGEKEHFTNRSGDDTSLPENDIRSLFQDNNGMVWIGLHTFGIAKVDLNQKPFYHLYYKHDQPSIKDNGVFSFGIEDDDLVWIATLKGLNKWNVRSNTFIPVLDNKGVDRFSQKMIWALYRDSIRNSMWVGYTAGLSRYNLSSKEVTEYKATENDPLSLKSNEIFSFCNDSTGTLWIGTYSGLYSYMDTLDGFKAYVGTETNTKVSGSIWSLHQDSKGRLWVGSSSGLYLYNYTSGAFELYFSGRNELLAHKGEEVLNITEDEEGIIWLSTPKGLVCTNPVNYETHRFGVENGFSDENIYAAISSGNSIWASSNRGLTKLDKDGSGVVNYSYLDGLQADEFSLGVEKLSNGMLLFGGINGVSAFYPDSIKESANVPDMFFNELQLNGEVVYPGQQRYGHVPLTTSILNCQRIEVSHQEKLITLNFSALDYSSSSSKIRYRYRMLPQSDGWVDIKQEPTINLINLVPGEYELEVESTNVDQYWVGNTKKLVIKVYPPFYRTNVFYLLVFLGGLALFLWIYRLRTARIKADNLRLESAVKLRTKEVNEQKEELQQSKDEISQQKESLEQLTEHLELEVKKRTSQLLDAKEKAEESDRLKSSFLANMSHEIRTPMNAIVGFSELLRFNDLSEDERMQYASLIKTNSDNLLHLLNDILDISVIESGRIALHKEAFLLVPMLEKVHQTFLNSPLYKDKEGVILEMDHNIGDDLSVFCDKARLSQILHNLVSNAIKYTMEGKVRVFAHANKHELLIRVEDTGIGIASEYLDKVFERFHKADGENTTAYRGGGLGLSISKNLAQLMDGEIWVESKVGEGSSFYVKFPSCIVREVGV